MYALCGVPSKKGDANDALGAKKYFFLEIFSGQCSLPIVEVRWTLSCMLVRLHE